MTQVEKKKLKRRCSRALVLLTDLVCALDFGDSECRKGLRALDRLEAALEQL